MTYKAACRLYFKWISLPGNRLVVFDTWYHEQGIEIEPEERMLPILELMTIEPDITWTEIRDYVANIITGAIRKLTDLIDSVKRGFEGTIETILNFFKDIWSAIGNIISTIAQVVNVVASGILNAIAATADWIIVTTELIINKINDVVRAVREWLGNLYEHVKEAIIGAFSAAIDGLKIALEAGKSWIKIVATAIWDGIKSVGNAIMTAFNGVINWVTGKFVAIYKSIEDVFTTVKDWIIGVFVAIGSTISNIITGIREGFVTGLDAVIQFFQELWVKITVLLDSLFDLSIEPLTEVFISIFSAQKKALDKLMVEAGTA